MRGERRAPRPDNESAKVIEAVGSDEASSDQLPQGTLKFGA
jgi:hypothetical protein